MLTHFHMACPALRPLSYSRAAFWYILTALDGWVEGPRADELRPEIPVDASEGPPEPFPLLRIALSLSPASTAFVSFTVAGVNSVDNDDDTFMREFLSVRRADALSRDLRGGP